MLHFHNVRLLDALDALNLTMLRRCCFYYTARTKKCIDF